MKSKIHLLFLAAALLIGFSGITFAQQSSNQPKCAPRSDYIKTLVEQWKERQAFLGIINRNTALEIFVNKETQTWTAITSQANGLSCIFMAGRGIKIFDNSDSEE